MDRGEGFPKRMTLNKMTRSVFLLVERQSMRTRKEFQNGGTSRTQTLGSNVVPKWLEDEMDSGKTRLLGRQKPGDAGPHNPHWSLPWEQWNPQRVLSRGML